MPRLAASSLVVLSVMGIAISGCIQPPPDNAPKADFTANVTQGEAPLTVNFEDESIGESPIQAWNWNFGDGNTSSSPSPVHTYPLPGTYTVQLTVSNAEGNDTFIREDYITVQETTSFDEVDIEGGLVDKLGVRILVPPGAVFEPVAFGIKELDQQAPLVPRETTIALSSSFRITHNNSRDEFYSSIDEEPIIPSTLAVPFQASGVADGDLRPGKVMLLARMPDGTTVPILGRIENGNIFVAEVMRFPEEASYTVVYRPEASLLTVPITAAKSPTSFTWPSSWTMSISPILLQQLTALDSGTLENTALYDRRDFNSTETDATFQRLKDGINAIQSALDTAGFREPALVPHDGRLPLVLYNMSDTYNLSFESFNDLTEATQFFGQIVIDPLQLLNVTQSNAVSVAQFPEENQNLEQEYTFDNALGQTVSRAVFNGYDYPPITVASGLFGGVKQEEGEDPSEVSFLAGLRDGVALFMGQHFAGLDMARSFAPNEFNLLSQTLLAPYLEGNPGYAASSQEFFLYTDRAMNPQPTFGYLGANTDPNFGVYEGIRNAFEELEVPAISLPFNQALLVAVEASDQAFRDRLGIGLGPAYTMYARDRGFENSADAILRPSDNERPVFSLNEDMFEESAIIHETFAAPTDTVEISANDIPALEEIPPLSSRVIVLDVHPFATELNLIFNTGEWNPDDNGNSLAVKAYKQGQDGMELLPNEDSLTVPGFMEDPDDCLARVVVFVTNESISTSSNFAMTAGSVAALDGPESNVLDDYIATCDPNSESNVVATTFNSATGLTTSIVELTSGAWRGPNDVDQTVWEHTLSIVEPPQILDDTALLLITGGSTGDQPDEDLASLVAPFALSTGTVVAVLQAVPNQPLLFAGETTTRSEDAILAYSYDQYMDGFTAGEADKAWPALLPMTRAATRAMDIVQEVLINREEPATVNDFVVTGASKRGWTTWLTAAADPRVNAIMPVVIDVLNMDEQMDHHFNAYGFFSPAIQDYVELNVFQRFGTPAGDSLLSIVDPFEYLDRLTMPKFIVNATGDQFFLPDSSQFYYDQLPGSNRLFYKENADHGLTSGGEGLEIDNTSISTMLAYYIAHIRGEPIPEYTWNFEAPNRLVVQTPMQPTSVKLWQATNPETRDFRLGTLQDINESFTATNLTSTMQNGQFTFTGEVEEPTEGWKAYFIQLTWEGPQTGVVDVTTGNPLEANHIFSTEVKVIPETLPFE